MITANQMVWLIIHLDSTMPPHGQGWLVSHYMADGVNQSEDAAIVVWKLDKPKPEQADLLAAWAQPDIQAEYQDSLNTPKPTLESIQAQMAALQEQLAALQGTTA